MKIYNMRATHHEEDIIIMVICAVECSTKINKMIKSMAEDGRDVFNRKN